MSEKTATKHTTAFPAEDATPEEYDRWLKAKVGAALAEADAHPERLIPQAEVFKKFGLEPATYRFTP